MEYLLAFKDYIEKGNTSRHVPFSPQLIESLQKLHQETTGQGWPLIFEIIPPTQERKKQSHNVIEMQYSGKFVFNFFRNGLFYEYPEENAPTHSEKPVDDGSVNFRFSGDGQTIETVYETFTGNTYGKQTLGVGKNNVNRLYFFLGLGLLLLLILKLL